MVPLGGVVGGTILSILVSDIDDRIADAGGTLQLIAAAQASQLLSAIGGSQCRPGSRSRRRTVQPVASVARSAEV